MSGLERLQRIAQDGLLPIRERRGAADPPETLDRGFPIALTCVTTAATLLLAYVGFLLMEDRFPSGFLTIWNRWDTVHYIHLARDGYGTEAAQHRLIIWPPLYSWLMRAGAPFLGGYLNAGLVISFVCYGALNVLLYRLIALDFHEPVARRTLVYLAIFPTSYFLHAAYTEALFLLLVVGSFLAARQERWVVAGALGGLAALTRVTWVALFPALLVEYAIQKRFRLRAIRPDVLGLALIPAGFAVFLAINHSVHGNPFEFLEMARKVNFKQLSSPWVGMERVIGLGRSSSASRFVTIGVFEAGAGILALLAAAWCVLRMRASYGVYMAVSWVILGFNSFWLSTARYLVPLFPGFVLLALWGRRGTVHGALCLVFLMTYTLLLTLFVRGWWTY